jgi:hypothetical protein
MRTRTLTSTAAVATALVCAAVFSLLASGSEITNDPPVAPERCAIPRGSGHRATVLSNSYGRVWGNGYVRGNTQYTKYYACSNYQRKHRYLGTAHVPVTVDEGDETQPFARLHFSEDAIASTSVAFVKNGCPAGTDDSKCEDRLRWVRIKDGKLLHEVVVTGANVYIAVRFVIVNETHLAYVVARGDSTADCGTGCEVHLVGPGGDKVVDSGLKIDPYSLARGGNAIFWTNGNDARGYAVLKDPPGPLE